MRDRAELLGRAAQAWCTDKTWHIEMMPELAESFADILADDLKVEAGGIDHAAAGNLSEKFLAECEEILTARV